MVEEGFEGHALTRAAAQEPDQQVAQLRTSPRWHSAQQKSGKLSTTKNRDREPTLHLHINATGFPMAVPRISVSIILLLKKTLIA